ncbi:hypothetical protein DPMN_007821 [Dreissena polymorpha]|uniref:Uncharacterized protein n=1 Tax=Dreissena polymorpha TaxID=45954 RepID=A0A9D4MWW4_DREPO|nr:hypothetical protein DPMN_007821 [Dreissena polymorpha]
MTDQVYKNNDITQSIVSIGTRRSTTRQRPARGIPCGHSDNNNDAHNRLDSNDMIKNVNDDVSERIPPNDENPPTRDDISSHEDDIRFDTSFMD